MVKKQRSIEIVYGIHPIQELVRAKKRRLLTVYTTKPQPKQFKVISAQFPKGLDIQYVDRKKLDTLAGTTDHQGIVGITTPFIFRKQFFNSKKQPFLLLLDGIQDVRNLGAILRTAYCVGVQGIIIPEKSTAPLTAAALKASAGLAEHLDILKMSSSKAALPLLEKAGYQLYVTIPEQGENALNVEYRLPLCLVIGSEGFGISPELKKRGYALYLPQKEADISYNASVAAGILLFLIATKTQLI